MEEYNIQPVNLLYAGKMNLVDGSDPLIILGEWDKGEEGTDPAIYPEYTEP